MLLLLRLLLVAPLALPQLVFPVGGDRVGRALHRTHRKVLPNAFASLGFKAPGHGAIILLGAQDRTLQCAAGQPQLVI